MTDISWKSIRLGNHCSKIGSGATPRGGKESYQTSGISLIRSQNVHNWGFSEDGLAHIDEQQAKRLDNVKVSEGDVLLNITGDSVARVCQAPNHILPARVNQHVAIIRPDNEKIDADFLRYYLVSPAKQSSMLALASGGATRNAITKSMIEDFEIPCPSIEMQRAIASKLSVIDNLIVNNSKRIKILEDMARLIYHEWFVQYRYTNHEKIKMVDSKSELGQIPKDWQLLRLDQVCESIMSGGTPRTNSPEYWGGNIPWLSSGETGNNFIFETEKTITDEGVSESSTRLARSGCTVIASAGQGKTRGQTSMLRIDCYINQSIIALTADRKFVTDNFLFFDLERRYSQFRQISDGSTRGSLTTKLLAELTVIVPSPELVSQFDSIVEPMVRNIELMLRKNNILRRTRDLLLPKLISGQLAVV